MSGPHDKGELEERLSQPSEKLVETLSRLGGDILILGVGGKMGPSLARMARRATDAAGTKRRVIGVSRFSNKKVLESLDDWGVETIEGDLLDPEFVDSLPEAANVVYLLGMKFGTGGREATTWATNTHAPSLVCRRFSKSRISAFSTGNIYGLVPVADNSGSVETDAPNPLGEYAMSCLGRERVFEYFSREHDICMSIIRLNYAAELRYGVLVDLAKRVNNEERIDLAMGYVNVIWQADACAYALCALDQASSPPFYLNVTGPEVVRCRNVCEQIGALVGKPVRFSGSEAPTALLIDASRAWELYGCPRVTLDEMVRWTADWIMRGGEMSGKSTHFEVRDGRF